jgi:di/tricarboxylate transporter
VAPVRILSAGRQCPHRRFGRAGSARLSRLSLGSNYSDLDGDDATMSPHEAIPSWSIVALATAGVIIRPFRVPEAVWALAGVAVLLLLGLLPVDDAIGGIAKGIDVYLFLIGMMLIAELAQREGLFDYLAGFAVEHARGSPQRLFPWSTR